MMKRILVLILLVASATLNAQFTFINPSFEGTPQPHVVPGPWDDCFGSPDTQPNQWGITLPPTDGSSYVSFLHDGAQESGYNEGASQQMNGCFTAGVSYTFTMDIAWSDVYNTAEPDGCYGSVAIYGGNSICAQDELLWSSGMITTTGWNTVTVTFIPTQNYCYVTFCPIWLGPCNGYINGMVDNITPIVPTETGIIITDPLNNANIACDFLLTGTTDTVATSVTLFGNFNGSPLPATLIPPTGFQANIDYPDNLSGPQTIIAVGVFPNGDVKTDTLTFNLIDFDANFTADTVCSGTPTHFTSTSTVTSPGTISGYAWLFEPGQTSTQQNPTYSFAQPGLHSVQLIVSSNPGCTDTITKQVLVLPNAIANFDLNAGCFGIPVTFTDQSTAQNGTSITNWSWNFGDNSPGSNLQNPTHTYPNGGTYTIELIVQATGGCADTLTQQVTVDPVPVANFSGTPVTGCMPLAVAFSDQSNGNGATITTWAWSFGDSSTSTLQDPNHTYSTYGTYDVTLIVGTASNCTDTIILPGYITVDPCPDITIVDPQPADTVGCKYTISGTTNIPVNSVFITGDILGAPVSATLIDSTHWQIEVTLNPNQQGTAVLYATGNFGNNGTEVDTVNVIVDCPFAIPNVFTPDGDGINDFFDVIVGATTKYQMDIYNRWGRKVFSSSSQTVLWDGKVNDGADASAGVYYFIFTGEQAGKTIEKHGTVTLVKQLK